MMKATMSHTMPPTRIGSACSAQSASRKEARYLLHARHGSGTPFCPRQPCHGNLVFWPAERTVSDASKAQVAKWQWQRSPHPEGPLIARGRPQDDPANADKQGKADDACRQVYFISYVSCHTAKGKLKSKVHSRTEPSSSAKHGKASNGRN